MRNNYGIKRRHRQHIQYACVVTSAVALAAGLSLALGSPRAFAASTLNGSTGAAASTGSSPAGGSGGTLGGVSAESGSAGGYINRNPNSGNPGPASKHGGTGTGDIGGRGTTAGGGLSTAFVETGAGGPGGIGGGEGGSSQYAGGAGGGGDLGTAGFGGGGAGGQATSSISGAGGGGGGAPAKSSTVSDGTTTTIGASIAGGNGGDGGAPGTGGNGGAGGGGGAGAFFTNAPTAPSTITIDTGVTVAGGHGGKGTGPAAAAGGVGAGGGGGVGLGALGNFSIVNNGTIQGGAGGDGGNLDGTGGGGGAGVAGKGAVTLSNDGTIVGGSGGSATHPAYGGVGVVMAGDSHIINDGTIQGGTSGNSSVPSQADSVLLSGGGNTLQIDPGSNLVGTAVSLSGTTNGGDTLDLGSDSHTYGQPGQFDVSNVGSQGKYQGFQHLVVSGRHARWDVTGNNTSGLAWTVDNEGALFISSPSVLGGKNIILDAGGLANLTSMTLTNGIVCMNSCALGSKGGTLTLDNSITGSGRISFVGTTSDQGKGTTVLNTPLQVTGEMEIKTRDIFVVGQKGAISSPRMVLDNGTLNLKKASASVQVSSLIGTGSVELGTNTLTLDRGAKFFGSIDGNGNVIIAGKLPVALLGTSTYSGTTTIEPGATLDLTSGGVPDSIINDRGVLDTSGDVAPVQAKALTGSGVLKLGPYPLILNDPSAAVFTGTVQGAAGVHVNGGSETLTGKNSFAGGLYIDKGAVYVAQTASLGKAGVPVHLSQGGALHAVQPLTLSRPVDVGTGGGTIAGPALASVDPQASAAAVLQNKIVTGGPLTMSGTVIDNGAAVTGTGAVTVQNGLLEVGDASHASTTLAAPVTVAANGILRGHGTITGNVTNSAGTVYPGGTIGILHVQGNYTQTPASTLSIEITPNATTPGQGYDQLSVTGTASLAGSLAVQVDSGTYKMGTNYDILHATKGVSGHFSSVSYSRAFSLYIQPVVTYQANDVRLNLEPRPSLFSSGKATAAHLYIETQATASTLNALFSGHAGFWSHGLGAVGTDAGASVYDFGGVTGYGTHFGPRMIVGGALAAGGTRTSLDQGRVSTTDEGVYGYMRYTVGHWRISGAAGVGHSSLRSHRYLVPTMKVARGTTEGWNTAAGVDVRYIHHYGNLIIDPFTSLEYVRSTYNGFTDQGGQILDLAYEGQAANIGIVTAGGRVGIKTSLDGISILPWAMLGVTDYIGDRNVGGLETLGGGAYQAAVPTTIAPAGSVDTGVGVQFVGRHHWGASVAYHGQFSNQSTLSSVDVALDYRW